MFAALLFILAALIIPFALITLYNVFRFVFYDEDRFECRNCDEINKMLDDSYLI